ncbi:hypothetical protein [Caballeronia ptereochthonis]|uniref:Baseplate J-like protein n=1 Tax=Caballeronia ptereochthonis TaxID=1777144 RepID=A0A158DYR9_9BURK|nr:hypothetical protein [Caballeronia ptereochthonis]SAK99728.1 hypothetical protein AWB83_06133 [Caballeronia ptereochthonis]
MNRPDPTVEARRAPELFAQLAARARLWLPGWQPVGAAPDFIEALLRIAAKLESEVAERLDRTPAKAALGLLDWLAIRPQAGLAARLPVVFGLSDRAVNALLAVAPVRIQANAGDTPVAFETQQDVQLVLSPIVQLVGANLVDDVFDLPPASVLSVASPEPAPAEWLLTSDAPAGSARVQLAPALGLGAGMVLRIGAALYVVSADPTGDLVPLDPPLASGAAAGTQVVEVRDFAPFAATVLNRQVHALYIGDDDALNLETAATITVDAAGLPSDLDWRYWGKTSDGDPAWLPLAAEPAAPGILLRKSSTAPFEPLEIHGVQTRWLRATAPGGDREPTTLQSLGLKIASVPLPSAQDSAATDDPGAASAGTGSDGSSGVDASSDVAAAPKLEAVANTTAIVLNDKFYPFGQIPRQFDAFYVASPEAFSKSGATVTIAFRMSDATSGPSVLVPMRDGGFRVFGVGRDGALHQYVLSPGEPLRLRYLGPARPALSGDDAGGAAASTPRFLGADWRMPPAVASQDGRLLIAVWSGADVWAWTQSIEEPSQGRWSYCGTLPGSADGARVRQLVALGGDGSTELALLAVAGKDKEGTLYDSVLSWQANEVAAPGKVELRAPWTRIAAASPAARWQRIAPVLRASAGPWGAALRDVFFALDADGHVALFGSNGDERTWKRLELPGEAIRDRAWSPDFTPLAVLSGVEESVAPLHGTLELAGVRKREEKSSDDKLLYYSWRDATISGADTVLKDEHSVEDVDLSGTVVGAGPALAPAPDTGPAAASRWSALLTLNHDHARSLARWPAASDSVDRFDVPSQIGLPNTSPAVAGARLIVPGANRDILIATVKDGASQQLSIASGTLSDAFVTTDELAEKDVLEFDAGRCVRADAGRQVDFMSGSWLYLPGIPLDGDQAKHYVVDSADLTFSARRRVRQGKGVLWTSAASPDAFETGMRLLLEWSADGKQRLQTCIIETVKAESRKAKAVVIEVDAIPDVPNRDTEITCLGYRNAPPEIGFEVHPTFELPPQKEAQQLLTKGRVIRFAAQDIAPREQTVSGILPPQSPARVVLSDAWTQRPASGAEMAFSVDTTLADWQPFTGDVSTNPALSWEYWNGAGWWKLDAARSLRDTTGNLKTSGTLQFMVPDDMARTNVIGRDSYWIRARLVGGDYGRERYTIVTTPPANSDGTAPSEMQTQTAVLDTDDIHAPIVLQMTLAYQRDESVPPQHVISFDNGSWRDQSEANRSGAAVVEAFVSLRTRLGRFDGTASGSAGANSNVTVTAGPCCAPCTAAARAASGVSAAASTTTGVSATPGTPADRALFVAFSKPLSGGPIRLLLLVADSAEASDVPLVVEALRNNRFEPLIIEDGTRGLLESGVVTLSLDTSPTLTELFGMAGYWLRVRPRDATAATAWAPRLLGAYINAVWAHAAETQEMEVLGSSDGSPSQTFALSRPPVLSGTLELRVLEPLGDEEMDALRAQGGEAAVLDDVFAMPGRWVRWTEVDDPGDAGPDERVFALDFASGAIVFGDGLHGAIPPAGRDAVVAFSYQRGGAAGGNAVPAFGPLDLVTPLEGVESVVAVDAGAGGADPENAATLRRFAPSQLRNRGRAVTRADLEDLALGSSPDIAQARALNSAQGIKLVVAMRGQQPLPDRAQRRALSRYLLSMASPLLARPAALNVIGPRLVSFRVVLTVRIDMLDVAGRVAGVASERMRALFDPATGGADGYGWPLGAVPDADDVAAALVDIDGLSGIATIDFEPDGAGELPPAFAPDQLAWLVADGVQVHFLDAAAT